MEGYQATFSSLYGTNQSLNGSFDGGNTTCGTGNGADSNTIIVSITSNIMWQYLTILRENTLSCCLKAPFLGVEILTG